MALPKFTSEDQAVNYLQTQWAAILDPIINKINGLSSSKAPTLQKFLSGSGGYMPSADVLYIQVQMVAGGGGSDGTAGGSGGGPGSPTIFGLMVCNPGTRVTGGTAFLNNQANAMGFALSGGTGSAPAGPNNTSGGPGACSPFGGAGGGNNTGAAGIAAVGNTGSGAGGAGGAAGGAGGYGGGAGGYIDVLITNPTKYSYSVGTGGAPGSAGSSGSAGAEGASGIIVIKEFYQ